MVINTNTAALNAQANNKITNNNLTTSLEKLSSGLKLNRSSDDASGMAIADKLSFQASALSQGIDNANSANKLINIADQSMKNQVAALEKISKELIKASTDTTSAEGRESIRKEIQAQLRAIDAYAKDANYNGTSLIEEKGKEFNFQIGSSASANISLTVEYSVTVNGLGKGEESVSLEDSTINYSEGVGLKGIDSAVTIQHDTDKAACSAHQKGVLIGGSTADTFTTSGLVAITLEGENVNGIGFDTDGGGTITITTTDAGLKAELDSQATDTAANNMTKVADGIYEVTTGNDYVIEFDEMVDITDLTISGITVNPTVALSDKIQLNTDDEVTVTKIDGNATLKLSSTLYSEAAGTVSAAGTASNAGDLIGKTSTIASGLVFDSTSSATAGVIVEEGTVGVQFDVDSTATSFCASAAVMIENVSTAASATTTDESDYKLNANKATELVMTYTQNGTAQVTMTTDNADTIKKLDELAENNTSLTKLQSGSYTYEVTSTGTATKSILDFGGEFDIKDLKISGQDNGEDIFVMTEGEVFVSKEDSTDDDEDVRLRAVTVDKNDYSTTNIRSGLKGADADIIQTSESLAGLGVLEEGELTKENALKFMSIVTNALEQLNSVRADFGATQNQLKVTIQNMTNTEINVLQAESVIRDVDFAEESANFNKQNIFAQAGTYAMSQANQVQQNVLRLLQ